MIRVKSLLDNIEDEDGVVEEDMHLDRVIKLLDKVTVLDSKNDLIKKKLTAKGLDADERQDLKAALDKNVRNIVKLCRKVRFSRRQIDRMVANLRVYLDDVEKVEEDIRRCKEDTGLSLTQLESAWSKMNKSAKDARQVVRETGVSLEKLKAAEQVVKEANRRFKKITQETGLSVTAPEKGDGGHRNGGTEGGDREEKTGGGEPAPGREHREEVHEPGPAVSGPDSGGEYRPDEGRR